MRTFKLLASAFLCFGLIQANAVEFNLEGSLHHEFQLSWKKVTKFKHNLKCYPGGKGDEREDLGSETIRTGMTLDTFESKNLSVQSGRFVPVIGDVSYNLSINKTTDYEEAVFSLNDAVIWSAYRNIGDTECILREYHWKVGSHRIAGDYKINIQIPQNTWLISVSIPKNEGQIAKISGPVEGGVHSVQIENQETLLWVKPGSTISIPIHADGYAGGGRFGEIRVQVKKSLSRLNDFKQDGNSRLLEIRDKLLGGEKRGSNELIMQFLEIGHQLLQNSQMSELTTQNFGLEKNKVVLDWLFAMANDPSTEKYGKFTQHVKAMAAAVGYQLSLNLLIDLTVFCQEAEVFLPLTGKTIRSNGLKAAYFWISKDLKRLENLRFPEIRAFVEEIVRWENSNLRYSDIAGNKAEFKKLDEGYIKMRRFSEIGLDIFGDIKFGLEKTLSKFGTLGSNMILVGEIRSQLTQLADQRRSLNRDLTKLVNEFTYTNHDFIRAASLLTKLNELESQTKILAKDIKAKTKLVAVDGNTDSATATMTNLFTHQMAIFERPLASKFADAIRVLFFKIEEDRKLSEKYSLCIGETNL